MLTVQQGQVGKPRQPGILKEVMVQPEGGCLENCLRWWLVPKRYNHIISYYKMKGVML